jgi:protein-tyrosine-phosphatase
MKRVLFVCVQNSCRSQMAEGFARKFGADIIEPYSAGSQPSGIVNPKAISAMKEVGIDILLNKSKGFAALPTNEWDAIVTMGCGDACPFLPAKQRFDWDLPEPRHMSQPEFNKVRNEIHRLVTELIKDLT